MSESNSTRLRSKVHDATTSNSDSQGIDRSKPADQPQGKALKQQSFASFTNKLLLAITAVICIYFWHLSNKAAAGGGWWNLMTGQLTTKHAHEAAVQHASATAASVAASASAHPNGQTPANAGAPQSVEAQILQLASSLGVKPRQLTEAIAPLLSPSLASPSDPAFNDAEKTHEQEASGGVGGVVSGMGTILDTFAD